MDLGYWNLFGTWNLVLGHFMMGRIGWLEIVVIIAVVALLFGAKRLPALGKALGEAIREFQQAMKNGRK